MTTPSIDQLRRAVEIKEEIEKLETELQSILGQNGRKVAAVSTPPTEAAKPGRKKGKMSAAGRAAIRAAQKARWDKIRAAKAGKAAPSSSATVTKPKKRTFSPATKAKMAAAQKARWDKIRKKAKA